MNCHEFRKVITPAVDGLLEGKERADFEQHARKCRACRNEYELEAAVKSVVRRRVPLVTTPESVREAILKEVSAMDEKSSQDLKQQTLWNRMRLYVAAPMMKFVGPGIIILLAGLILLMVMKQNTAGGLSEDKNLLVQSMHSFYALQTGMLQPQVVSDNAEAIRTYLVARSGISVTVPLAADFVLEGGLTDEYNGLERVQVLYRRGSAVMDLIQVPLDGVLHGRGMALPIGIRNELVHNGWYIESSDNGDTILLWTRGVVLCVAVARLDQAELHRMFIANSENAGSESPW